MYTLFSSAFSGFTRGASEWRMMEDLNSTILAFDDDNCTCRFAMFSFSHLYRIGNTVDWPDKRLLPSFVCFVLFFCWRQNSQLSSSVVQGMPGHHWKGNLLRHHYRRFKKDSVWARIQCGQHMARWINMIYARPQIPRRNTIQNDWSLAPRVEFTIFIR